MDTIAEEICFVDYSASNYLNPISPALQYFIPRMLQRSAQKNLNVFIGVCPRFGTGGRFDQAWQVRTARAIWTDIDHVAVDEALQRVVKAKLPPPSIVVNSGNGVHLYWLLKSPYQIDDVGAPPAVHKDWIVQPNGRKKPRKYIVEHGDKVFLDERRHVSRISPQAEHYQDILAGVAQAIGGDHTTDLSRLLRLPGSFNRKDARNGREPMPTSLVECDATRKYPLAVFERLKSVSPETGRAKQIATMPLPVPRKITASKGDRLAELIAASSIAPPGSRSEADFAVCCYAVRNAISKHDLWPQVAQVGKFAEQGERYFNVTWENAEFDARAAMYDKIQKRTAPKSSKPPPAADDSRPQGGDGLDGDSSVDDGPSDARPTIRVDPQITPVSETLHELTDCLLSTGTCFSRTEQLVVIHDRQIRAVLSPPELAGLLNQFVEFYFVEDEGGEYKPLPAAYANTWLHHHAERARLSSISLFTNNPVYTDDWRLVSPGYDANSGIYYAGQTIAPREGTEYLDKLLKEFCFRSPCDRSNYLSVLLTALLIARFIGSKPAVLFNGNQPGLGKSILAQIIAILRDGQCAETATFNPNDEEFEKRLGAIIRRGVTTIIIDNAKARGRAARIESACLERSITDPMLSFRLLGQSASIRAENSHTFCITANSADVSRDLVTRSVVVNLHHEGDPQRRTFTIADPEGYAQQHRAEILGELIGMIERWKAAGMPMAKTHSRFNKRGWGNIVGGILAACEEPDFLDNAEEMALQLDETRRDFTELMGLMASNPRGTWTAAELVDYCRQHSLLVADLGEGSARSLSTKMGTLAGRFVGERFETSFDQKVVFHRTADRKGNVYRVSIDE